MSEILSNFYIGVEQIILNRFFQIKNADSIKCHMVLVQDANRIQNMDKGKE
jgi:hypothetical protein